MTKKKEVENKPAPLVGGDFEQSLSILKPLQQEIDLIGNNCMQIKVTDSDTLSVAENNLSKANDMVKFIESKRKEIKQPYLEASKQIDETCKALSENVEKAVAYLKQEIKTYELKRQEEQKKREEELKKKQEEEAAKAEAEQKRKKDILDYINIKLKNWINEQYESIKTIDDCDKLKNTLENKYPGVEKFGEFLDQGNALKETYLGYLSVKREQILKADSLSDEQKALLKEKEELLKAKEEIAKKERELANKEAELAAEKAKKEAEQKAEEERKKLAKEQEDQAAKTRKIWKYELVDKTKLIPDWITVDDQQVKDYLKQNKDKIKSGDVINGIKFYQDINISA